MLSDPFADFLTRIRNAGMARLRFVDVFANKLVLSVLELLREEGWIADFVVREEKGRKSARVMLKYSKNREPLIGLIVRCSKPGCRKYVGYKQLYPFMGGMGLFVLSTSRGVRSGYQARKEHLGGELLCAIAY